MLVHHPWEQQVGEGSKSYGAFVLYRDMGYERTYQAVSDKVQKDYSLIRRWAKRHNWANRALAYDAFLLKKDLEAKVKKIKDMNAHHDLLGSSAEGIVARKLGLELKKIERNPKYNPNMPWKDLIALLREGTELRRKALYEGKTNIKITGGDEGDPPIRLQHEGILSQSDEELLALVLKNTQKKEGNDTR